jgi:CarD family transcriptional regulator
VGNVVTDKVPETAMADTLHATATDEELQPTSAFHPGEFVVYPTHGVGKIEGIGTEVIAGHRLTAIRISFADHRMTLHVPVARVRALGVRRLASCDTLTRALKTLRGRPRTSRKSWAARVPEHLAKIHSGEVHALAEATRDLYAVVGNGGNATGQHALFGLAVGRLAAELAAVTGTKNADALKRITDALEQSETSGDDD